MIFIWTSQGGPLQYISLFLFLLQIAPWTTWYTYLMENTKNHATTSVRVLALVTGAAMVAYGVHRGGSFSRITRAFQQEIQALWRRTSRLNLWLVVAVVLAITILLGLTISSSHFSAQVALQIVQSLVVLLQFAGVFFFVWQQQQQLQQNQQGDLNNNRHNNNSRIHEIVDLVLKLPIEEFVPLEEMEHCRVSTLQEMLKRRMPKEDNSQSHPPNFVEKRDLVAAVQARRNYNESCCICYEDYQTGDPLRVLPKCRHEFHVDCLDSWAYTFANKNHKNENNRQRQPTCPLCNTTL